MIPELFLCLTLLALQVTTPASPQPTDPPAASSPQSPSPNEATAAHPAAGKTPCHEPDGSGKYNGVCGVTHPRVLHFVNPKFSKEARKQKVMGVAWVGLTVDSEGNPVNVHIVRSISGQVDEKCRAAALTLDARAVDAVKLYKFAPATYKGKPVPVELRVDVNFQIF